ncbi:MAG TPA: alpha/beta hydrolase [Bryobacteraceae bacterium]
MLDWGGRGKPIILLAGGGQTAHIFDDFAPKLGAGWHVYGITRRGYGSSGYSATNVNAHNAFAVRVNASGDSFGDDVFAVIDALKLKRPILIGHSIAGAELSSVANNHPGRIAGLVYLDAAHSYAFDNGQGADAREMQALRGPQPPPPEPADLASFTALQKYFERVDGFRFPEAELREEWESTAGGRVIKQRDFPGNAMLFSLFMNPRKYTNIPVPALLIFSNPHSQGAWVEGSTDASVRAAADAYSAALAALTDKQEKAVKDTVPAAHVVTLPNADHFIFLSNAADVLREIRGFLAGLD